MASQNSLPFFKNTDLSEIHDVPIVPPKPIAQKKYKEIVPDISVVSDIADDGSTPQHFQNGHFRPQIGSKYFKIQPELNAGMLSRNNLLLSTPSNLHLVNNYPTFDQQQLEIDSCITKTAKILTEKTDPILNHNTPLPVQIYLDSNCLSCVKNRALIASNNHNGMQYILPKDSSPVLFDVRNEQSDKEIRSVSSNEIFFSNKMCCKHIESNVASSSHKPINCNQAQHLCASNSKEPEISQFMDIPDCYCSKDQQMKLRKSQSKCERCASDSGLGESKKTEDSCEKELVDRSVMKNKNILCPTCWKKTNCTCNFSSKKITGDSSTKINDSEKVIEKSSGSGSPHAFSDELSSIWEYLKKQDEKIDLINKKVLNFLSQHESCCIDQPAPKNEISNATDSDIPYILNILEVHSDKIGELQDQINSLKPYEHKSSPAIKSIVNEAETANLAEKETCNKAINLSCSCNMVSHEQRQKVTKTSTSTMTSFAIDNSDKLVYHKQLTVVTDVTKEKNESFLQEHDSPINKNHVDFKNVNSNSQKKTSRKSNKASPRLKCQTTVSSSSSDALDSNDNQALKTAHKRETKSKHASPGNKVTNERLIDCAMKDNVKEKKNTPSQKTAAQKSHVRPSKHKPKISTSPKTVDVTKRNSRHKKITRQISESSLSTESECNSPVPVHEAFDSMEFDSEKESITKSKYGLSSKYLSIATKTYLDKFQLHLDKNNRTGS